MSPACASQRRAPWDQPDTLYFYGGPFSNFAPTPGLALPEGWHGHPRPAPRVIVASTEHYFQACKATSREDFLWVLGASSAAAAKRRGGPRGEGGRRIELRPDWEEVKLEVMRCACRGKFSGPRLRSLLLASGERPLVEDSPTDFIWGGRDGRGGYQGRNLLGIVLMEVRAQMREGSGR